MKTNFSISQTDFSDNLFELIEGCRRGDQKAQLKVFKLYSKPLLRICMHLVKDPVEAENIMHESFLQAFENIKLYPGNISFQGWIMNFIKSY